MPGVAMMYGKGKGRTGLRPERTSHGGLGRYGQPMAPPPRPDTAALGLRIRMAWFEEGWQANYCRSGFHPDRDPQIHTQEQ